MSRVLSLVLTAALLVPAFALAESAPESEARHQAATAERPPSTATARQVPAAPREPGREIRSLPAGYAGTTPPWVLDTVSDVPEVVFALALLHFIWKPIAFLALFVGVGVIFTRLAASALGVRPPAVRTAAGAEGERAFARLRAIVWVCALAIACQAVGLGWISGFGTIIAGAVGGVLKAVAWLVLGLLLAYALSSHGRACVTSLMAWGYLARIARRTTREGSIESHDIGAGVRGRITFVDPFVTTFTVEGGGEVRRPNAEVARELFGWPD